MRMETEIRIKNIIFGSVVAVLIVIDLILVSMGITALREDKLQIGQIQAAEEPVFVCEKHRLVEWFKYYPSDVNPAVTVGFDDGTKMFMSCYYKGRPCWRLETGKPLCIMKEEAQIHGDQEN